MGLICNIFVRIDLLLSVLKFMLGLLYCLICKYFKVTLIPGPHQLYAASN